MGNEEIAKKALELLFDSVESTDDLDLINHLNLIDYAIKDYKERFKCNLDGCQERVDNLRESYLTMEEERAYEGAVKNFWDKL